MEYNKVIHKCKDLWQVDKFVYSGRMLTKNKELYGEILKHANADAKFVGNL